jgi:hypothetical protein
MRLASAPALLKLATKSTDHSFAISAPPFERLIDADEARSNLSLQQVTRSRHLYAFLSCAATEALHYSELTGAFI